MENLTLSQWVKQNLDKPSVIAHPHKEPCVFVCGYYGLITSSNCGMAIIGLFHLDYLRHQPLPQPSVASIHEAMLTIYGKDTIRKELAKLVNDEWITAQPLTREEIKEILCQKQPQRLSIGFLQCSWCKCETVALQEHHYPIPKAQKGSEVVAICANCHFEFHQLLSVPRYRLTEKAISFFEDSIENLIKPGDQS